MKALSKIKRINLRDVWAKEASEFTPWLAENIGELGEVLGMDLELEGKEAGVGPFSLDLLVKDVGSGRMVVVENQLTPTDHDHLGKLLTYAAGFDASTVIWVAESIREEHRQALDWLNQRTNTDTEFFGVVVEVLQIDDSKPACNFKPVVFPNDWQKTRRNQVVGKVTPKGEAYRQYFQLLIDELRENHKFTGARLAQPQSWYAFSSGISNVSLAAAFAKSMARVELYIDHGELESNKAIFDWLHQRRQVIEEKCGTSLDWDRLDDRRACRISVSRPGSIESAPDELQQIRIWQIDKLLAFKKVFPPLVRTALKGVDA